MAAFAHLVGFNEDKETVLHMHPIGAPISKPKQRGGPELDFKIYATKPGFVRLFARCRWAAGRSSCRSEFALRPDCSGRREIGDQGGRLCSESARAVTATWLIIPLNNCLFYGIRYASTRPTPTVSLTPLRMVVYAPLEAQLQWRIRGRQSAQGPWR